MGAGHRARSAWEDETLHATLQRDGHHADLSGGSRDDTNIAGGHVSAVLAEGLEAAYQGKTRPTTAVRWQVAQTLWSYWKYLRQQLLPASVPLPSPTLCPFFTASLTAFHWWDT